MKRNYRNALAIALLGIGISGTGYAQLGVGAAGAVNGTAKGAVGAPAGVVDGTVKGAAGAAGNAGSTAGSASGATGTNVDAEAKARAERVERERRASGVPSGAKGNADVGVGVDANTNAGRTGVRAGGDANVRGGTSTQIP